MNARVIGVSLQVLIALSTFAAPRAPMWPPLPELTRVTYHESFDEAFYAGVSNAVVSIPNYGTLRESWSGYSLERVGVVPPLIIPGLGETGRVQVATDQGALRFWFRPYWSSGTGPGTAVRLAELAAVGGSQSAMLWSLQVSADGSSLQLIEPGGNAVLLEAELAWTADSWHQVILNYGTNGTELALDGAVVTKGAPTLAVPASVTRLIIGSSLSGEMSAGGEFEEVFCFARPLKIAFHYTLLRDTAALGPISEEEQAYRQELLAKWQALKAENAKEAEESAGGGGMEMLRLLGPIECVTNSPLYITNASVVFVTNQNWTVTFDVQGTNGTADIFATTNLYGNHVTNSTWVWLERGPTCATYQYTNQPTNQTFYILGTTNDTDADGLTDAYELLTSKTLISTNDTDGDSIPDAWEVAHGLNPLVNDASDDPDADALSNYQEYLENSDPLSGVMVVAWGKNSYGQCNVLTNGLRDVVAVAGGEKSSFALKQDGTVVAWGGNAMGETDVPVALTNISTITANGYASCSTPTGMGLALSNGVVIQWGTTLGTQPPGLNDIKAVAAGAFHGLALRSNGTVIAWGNTNQWAARVPTSLSGVKAITTGWHHSVALLSNGTLTAWGLYRPELGYTLTNAPAGLTDLAAVSAYGLHTLALRSNGTVVAWGYNQSGQTNVPTGLSNVVALAAGAGHSLVLKSDGTVASWGFVSDSPASLDKVTAIASGQDHCLAVRTGKLTPVIVRQPVGVETTNGGTASFNVQVASLATNSYQWQSNAVNLSGATSAALTLSNVTTSANYRVLVSNSAGEIQSASATLSVVVPGPPIVELASPSPGFFWFKSIMTIAVKVTASGESLNPALQCRYQWKSNGVAIAGRTLPLYVVSSSDTADYSVTITNALGSTNVGPWRMRSVKPGTAAGWGNADSDLLDTPVSATNVVGLATGPNHSLAVREDGVVVAWGSNVFGQTNVPVTLTNATSVAVGDNHSLALREDGTVVAWGRNHFDQTNVPAGLTNVTAIAAAGNYSLALLRNGTVTNWGDSNVTIPANLTNLIAIAAGKNFSLALRSNGTVVAWGENDFGQTNVPAGLTNVVAIAAGGVHALALKENGTVAAWGSLSNAPADLTDVMAVAAGRSHNVALRNTGRVVSWGDNSYGQTNITANLFDLKLIAAGGDHTLFSVFDPLVQYPVDVTKDLLLIYNTTSTNSTVVKDYYLARRPLVSGASVLGVACTNGEFADIQTCSNQIVGPYLTWLAQNPTRHPQYILTFVDMPSMVYSNSPSGSIPTNSLQVLLSGSTPGIQPFVTSINMATTNDCIGYIDKIASFANTSATSVEISASNLGYANTNYFFDDIREDFTITYTDVTYFAEATIALNSVGIAPSSIFYVTNGLSHLRNCTNVAGYFSWGAHGGLTTYATNTDVLNFLGASGWFLIETEESFNGLQSDAWMGTYTHWYFANAFGGHSYSHTPAGAVCHVSEPTAFGINHPSTYFGLWSQSKRFSTCAWVSKQTRFMMAVGDPFVRR